MPTPTPPSTVPSVPNAARVYDALRPKILQRLVETRASLDATFARMDEAVAREQLGAVLERVGNFIATGDLGLHRAFLHTFLAMRAAEAQLPGAVLAMLVAIGDTSADVAQEQGTAETSELALMLTRVTASTARAVNDLIAEELERRTEQLGELRTKEQAALEPV
ncbi:MAG TPA: hypothetical protein VGG74_01675 [Kofleriaceae bacterium]|jgi:hypothetical protein